MRVPKDLAPTLRKQELKRSLNTKDFREARRRYQSSYGELLRNITEARERVPLDEVAKRAMAQTLTPMAEGTAKDILRNPKAFFSWLNDEGLATHNPFRKN